MKAHIKIVVLIAAALCTVAYAQESPSAATPQAPPTASQSAPAASQPAQAVDEEASTPSESSDEPRFSPFRALSSRAGDLAGRSYVLPTLDFSDRYDSQFAENIYSVSGSLALQREGRKTETAISYTGGGEIHPKRSDLDSAFHRLMASQTFYGSKWTLSFVDQFSYLPESPYGSYAYGGIDASMIDFFSRLFPDQSFLTPGASRYVNTASIYGNRNLSPKSSLHATVAYSFMQFADNGFVNYRSYSLTSGYTRRIGRDALTFDYNGSLSRFSGSSKMQSHNFEVSYQHPINRQFTVEVAAGPEAVLYTEGSSLSQTRILPDGRASLNWHGRLTNASVSYSHSSGSGGGLLRGAVSDSASLNLSRTFRRIWSAGWNAGYSRNSQITTSIANDLPHSYKVATTGVSLRRNFGRSFSAFVNYSFQYQMTGTMAPQGILRWHSVMAGFTFNLKPIAIH